MQVVNEQAALAEGLRVLGDVPPEHVVVMLDREGRILSWSKPAEELFGRSAEEVLGRAVDVLYSARERREGAPRRELDIATLRGTIERVSDFACKNGDVFRGIATLTAIHDEQGKLRGHVLLVECAVAALSIERYATRVKLADRVLRTAPFGITVQDASGRILYANEAAARLCGYPTPSAFVAAPLRETLSRFALLGEDGEPFPPELLPGHRVLAGEEPEPIIIQVRERATGRRWWSRVFAKPVRNAAGRAELAINVWHDVTDEQRRKESIHHLLELTAALMNTLDFETRLERLADDLVPRLADWCAIDLVENGRHHPLVVRGTDAALVEKLMALANARRNGTRGPPIVAPTLCPEVGNAELALVTRDPEALAFLRSLGLRSAMVVPLADGARPTGALVLAMSHSGRKFDGRDLQLARELGARASVLLDNARSYRAALEAVRMRDDFLSVAAHELRTPLASLSLLFETLIDAHGHQRELSRRLELGLSQVRRLGRLVEALLDVGRVTSGQLALDFEMVDVDALLREVVEQCAADAAQSGSALRLSCARAGTAKLDRLRVDQVVSNLIGNAIKYGAGAPIDVEADRSDGEIHIRVRDHGIGIAREDRDRIFRRFERAVGERHYPGLGLGLWIVREIVAAHGGRVTVDSEKGKGSCFEVTFPAVKSEGGARAT